MAIWKIKCEIGGFLWDFAWKQKISMRKMGKVAMEKKAMMKGVRIPCLGTLTGHTSVHFYCVRFLTCSALQMIRTAAPTWNKMDRDAYKTQQV